mgnify:CR=1 FL=1
MSILEKDYKLDDLVSETKNWITAGNGGHVSHNGVYSGMKRTVSGKHYANNKHTQITIIYFIERINPSEKTRH